MFLSFSIVMLLLLLIARYRSPRNGIIRIIWFFLSLLPSELPWAAALLQSVVIFFLLFFVDPFSAENVMALLLSALTLWGWYDLHCKTFHADKSLRKALHENLPELDESDVIAPSVIQWRHWINPFYYHRQGVEHLRDIAYGPHPRQQLDIYRPATRNSATQNKATPRPVLIQVHGGGWMLGHKHQQAQPLLHYLAQHDWLCVDINYRLAPHHPYPHCLQDVKTVIAWVKQHIAEYGGDPQFIALAGESAGAHLAMLAALTVDHEEFQWDATADTRVQAVVSLYGVYDLTENSHTWSGMVGRFLQKKIMPATPDILRIASPRHQIIENAPPVFVIHGTTDSLVFVEDAREFVEELRQTSLAPVAYAELDGAEHGFDLFHSVRTEYTITAIEKFLRHCYETHRRSD